MIDLSTDEGKKVLKLMLDEGTVKLFFKKKDGSRREMLAQLGDAAKNLMDEYNRNNGFYHGGEFNIATAMFEQAKPVRSKSPNVLSVVDVELNEWRSIRWDSITHINDVPVIKS